MGVRGGVAGCPWVEEPAWPFQAWKRHLPHPCQQQHPPAPPPNPADEVSASLGDGGVVVRRPGGGWGELRGLLALLPAPCFTGCVTQQSPGLSSSSVKWAVKSVWDGGWEGACSHQGPGQMCLVDWPRGFSGRFLWGEGGRVEGWLGGAWGGGARNPNSPLTGPSPAPRPPCPWCCAA